MSFGLGYLADGFLKGQERNRNWGLRQKQEERAQKAEKRAEDSHGIGMRIGGVNAAMAEEKMTPDAIARREEEASLGTQSKRQTVKNQELQGVGYEQQNQKRALDLTPEAIARSRELAEENLKSTKLSNQYQEYLNTKAGKEVSDEAQAWEKHLEKIVNQSDEANAQVELSQALDAKRYRMIQLVESGDAVGAAMFVNMSRANDKSDVAQMQKTEDGGLVGLDANGEIVINIAPEEVKGVISRIKQRQIGSKEEPKITMVPIYNDMGDKVGERPSITETDPRTGEQYIKYLEEKPASQGGQVADLQDRIDTVKFLYGRGEIGKEQYDQLMKKLGYSPENNQPQSEQHETYPSEEELISRRQTATLNQELPAKQPVQKKIPWSPRGQQDVVGGINQFIEDNMTLQGNQSTRPLSRR